MQKLESGHCFLLLLESAHLDRPAVCGQLRSLLAGVRASGQQTADGLPGYL